MSEVSLSSLKELKKKKIKKKTGAILRYLILAFEFKR